MKLPKAYATTIAKRTIDLTLSVNPLGCSPLVLDTLRKLRPEDISTYPDQTSLLDRLTKKFKISRSNILLGTGSEQLIKLISQACIRSGDTVVVESGSFFLFTTEPLLQGANIIFTELSDASVFKKRPTALFIANPTTPGGVDRSNTMLVNAIKRINPRIVVVDEANGEFRTESMISQIKTLNNLIVLRTFSKALGIAGLRIGFAVGNIQIMSVLQEFQQPFPVTAPALIAAETALSDKPFLRKSLRFIRTERIRMTKALIKRGFVVAPSVTNNLFVSRMENKKIIRELAKRNVGVIDGDFFPGNKTPGFRISLKDKQTNRLFLARLDEALACLPDKKLLGSKEVL